MKHIMNLFLMIAIIIVAMFTACSDDNKASDLSSLTIDQAEIDVLAVGGKTLINVNTDLTWNASVDAEWLRISPASGNGHETVSVEIDRHLGVRRAAKITFSSGAITKTVNVLQRGQVPSIEFYQEYAATTPIEDLSVTHESSIVGVFVRSNLPEWKINVDADWIHILEIIDLGSYSTVVVDESGEVYYYYDGVINTNVLSTKYVYLSVDTNSDPAARSGAISFSYDDYPIDTLKLSQTGLRIFDSDGYVIVDKFPFKEAGKYEQLAVPWQGQVGIWGEKYGVLAYKVTVTNSGKLKIVDHASPKYNIWFLLYSDGEAAGKGEHKSISDGDGTVEYDVTPGTYYVFGIMNTWYDDIALLTTIPYNIEITCE